MRTRVCDLLGIDVPIVQAPIIAPVGRPAGSRLAAAVSEAGGLGTVALWLAEIEVLRTRIREIRSLTAKPLPSTCVWIWIPRPASRPASKKACASSPCSGATPPNLRQGL